MNFFLGHVERAEVSYQDEHPIKTNHTHPGRIEFTPIISLH